MTVVACVALAALLANPVAHADVHAGSWGAKATLGGASYTQIYGTANVTANTNYTASIWIKGSGTLQLIVNNPAWTYFPVNTTVTATGTWTQITLPSFNSGSNTQLVLRLYDNIGSAGGSVMWIDDGFLGSGTTNLLGNPGFESGTGGWNVGAAFAIGQFGTGTPPLANGTYTLAPANSTGLRLDVQGQGTTNGTNVESYTANGGTNQQWILTNVTGNVYRLSPVHATAQCLDVSGQATASGTNVQTWQYLGQQNQNWALTAVSGGYTLTPQHATSLRLNNTGTASGSNVNVTTADGSTAQTWSIVAVSGGSAPAAPSSLAASAGNAQVSLSWSASSGATSYNVYRGTTANGESATALATGVTTTSYTNTGLTNGTTYYYKVRAVNASGTSGDSNEASATPTAGGTETIGGGTIGSPAVGPAASYGLGSGFTLVKNWNFGSGGTVKNMADMDANFYYHDQFNTIANGANYGGLAVASNSSTAINDGTHGAQPYVGKVINGVAVPEVRTFTTDYLRTTLTPLGGATTVAPTSYNVGCGSFMAKFSLANGGSLLNQDLIWETRVRMVTPPYFWFAIWNAGVQWNGGAEMDVVESFGYDNGGGNTNYDGRYWHSNSVGGSDSVNYSNWGSAMSSVGVGSFDATQWHTWTWIYRKNNTYSVYMDGINVQNGTIYWRLAGSSSGTPIDLWFLFDANWGHTQVGSVNHSMPASNLTGKYYDWDYSRVYLRN